MPAPIDNLKEAERKVFTATFQDGLLEIFLGCFVLMFAIAPLLSVSLGDFWSSFVFLPFWALVYLAIHFVRKHVVRPRLGQVGFGPARKARLVRFNLWMLLVLVAGLLLGILAAVNPLGPGWIYQAVFGLLVLALASVAAYFLDFDRLYLYGVLFAFSPMVGEWLYQNLGASHHGYPIVFGAAASLMILTGLILFIRFLREHPLPVQGAASVER